MKKVRCVVKKQELEIVRLAKLAKAAGYTHIASIVKNVYRTDYYHYNSVDAVIRAGRWIPAAFVSCMPGKTGGAWHGRLGVRRSELPEKTIMRSMLFSLEKEQRAV